MINPERQKYSMRQKALSPSVEKKAELAFKYWNEVLEICDQQLSYISYPSDMIFRLRDFQEKSKETFRYLLRKHGDPVYVLFILIFHCNEDRLGSRYHGIPEFTRVIKPGPVPKTPYAWKLARESSINNILKTHRSYRNAGGTSVMDQEFILTLKQMFELIPDLPNPSVVYDKGDSYMYKEYMVPHLMQGQYTGRPGEHSFNTAMCLLARYFEKTCGWALYTTIANLLNDFCPKTYDGYPLTKSTVRQRILHIQSRVKFYCEEFERLFEEIKKSIQGYPVPFNPWKL